MNYEDNSSAFRLTELPKDSQLRNIKKVNNNDEISDKSTNYQPLTIRKTDKELLSMTPNNYNTLTEEQLRKLSNLKK